MSVLDTVATVMKVTQPMTMVSACQSATKISVRREAITVMNMDFAQTNAVDSSALATLAGTVMAKTAAMITSVISTTETVPSIPNASISVLDPHAYVEKGMK